MNSPRSALKPLARLSLGVLLAGVLGLSGCNNGDNSAAARSKAQEYIARADSYQRQGQFRAAIIDARNALQQVPGDRAATLKLAAIFNELGQGKSAAQLLEPLAADANREEALALAQAYALQRKNQSALEYLAAQEARLKLAGDKEAQLIVARSYLALGRLDDAQRALAKLDSADVGAGLARVQLLLQRDPAAAQAELQRLLQQNPDNVQVLAQAATLAERDGRLDQAEDLLSKALINSRQTDILLPQKAEILQRLVSTLTKLGRSNEALIYAKTLADANPSGALLREKFKQGLELFQAGKLDDAEPILAEVYSESQNDTAGILLGMIRYAKKDLRGAAQYLDSNVDPEIAPEAAITTLAATQLQLSQPEKLLALFEPQKRDDIKSPELKMLVGIALFQTGDAAGGSKLIEAAQVEQPNNAAMRATLARFYIANRQVDKAIETLEPAVKSTADENLSRLLITAYAVANRPDDALSAARALADSKPPKADNWWVLGRTALRLQKLDIAAQALQESLKLQPDLLPAQLDMAQLHLTRKAPAAAETIYRDVLKQHPDLLTALKGLLIAQVQKGARDAALESGFLAAAGDNASAHAVLAEFYLRQQKLDAADAQLAAVADSEPSAYAQQLRQQVIVTRVAQRLQAKDAEGARALVAKGLEVNPRNPELLVLLARIDLQTRNVDSARKIAAQLAQTYADSPAVAELRGDLATLDGGADAAQHYRAVWAKAPGDGIALKLYQSLAKDPKAANAFIGEWERQLPGSANAKFLRGLQKQQAGDKPGAIASYEAALARNAKDARVLNNLAWLYFETDDKRAQATAEKAYALEPTNAAVLDTYGWIQYKSGRKQAALKLLEQARTLAPQSKEIENHLRQAQAGN